MPPPYPLLHHSHLLRRHPLISYSPVPTRPLLKICRTVVDTAVEAEVEDTPTGTITIPAALPVVTIREIGTTQIHIPTGMTT